MKTAERILLTSLELFNRQGEANVTCVDIALELDISPGNLYYHFKGKEIIVSALFDMYRERMDQILLSPNKEDLNVNDLFFYLLLILETSQLFRFLYRNPTDLAEKYPLVSKGFKKLIKEKESTFAQLFKTFRQNGQLKVSDSQVNKLQELLGLVFTQSLNYYSLKGRDIEDDDIVYESLSGVFYLLTPYLCIEDQQKETLESMITQKSF